MIGGASLEDLGTRPCELLRTRSQVLLPSPRVPVTPSCSPALLAREWHGLRTSCGRTHLARWIFPSPSSHPPGSGPGPGVKVERPTGRTTLPSGPGLLGLSWDDGDGKIRPPATTNLALAPGDHPGAGVPPPEALAFFLAVR